MKISPTIQLKNISVNFYCQTALILAYIAYSLSSTALASESWLTVYPEQCVSVHQGAKCFAQVQITWKMTKADDYCLFSSQQDAPLHCWKSSNQGKFAREFVSNQNITFYLKQKSGDTKLMTNKLGMAWVYKKNSRARSSWRMF